MRGVIASLRRRRASMAFGAGVVAVVFAIGVGATPAMAETLQSRTDGFDAAIDALDLPEPVAATPLTGGWGALPGGSSLELPSADAPVEDEQVVVLEEESTGSFAALAEDEEEGEDPPTPPAPVSVELGGVDVTVAPTDGPTPAAVRLRVAGEAETADAGVTGILLEVSDASVEPATDPTVELTVSYASFGGLVAGDWASRLRFVWIPDCESPSGTCAPQPIETINDPSMQTVTALVPVMPGEPDVEGAAFVSSSTAGSGGGSLAVTAGASGAQGDWSATSLAPTSSWGNAGSTGGFTWSLPLTMPPAAAGPAPQLGISYSSSGSDGRTPSTNNQSGVIGEGFSITEGYIERSYESCSDDENAASNNVDHPSGDLCWGDENATIMLNGSSQELVRDAVTGVWHPKAEDGSRVEHITGSSWNGGEANEYWKVTTTDGTQYYFGRGRVSSGGTALNSAWTVPVYGNDSGERCYHSAFADSSCTQVWRWNLEYVVDVSGNSMTYFYDMETNRYVYDPIDNTSEASASYVSGGHVSRIEYGTRAGAEGTTSAPARVVFDYAPRCITDLNDADSFCGASQTSTSSNHWLDTPIDLICTSSAAGACDSYWPVFFDQTRLSSFSTSTFDGTNYRPIDSWALSQTFDGEGVGVPLEFASNVTLVLRSVTHTGHGGTATTSDDITQPPFVFAYDFLANRITSSTLALPLLRPRVIAIRTDSGAQVSVHYVTDCAEGDVPANDEASQQANTRLCFPVKWSPTPGVDPIIEYFHAYVIDSIVESGAAPASPGGSELITGSVDKVTTFEYSGGAAWAKPTGAMIDPSEVTYSDFLGFGSVTTAIGVVGDQTKSRMTYFRGTGATLTAGPASHLVSAQDKIEYRGQVFSTTTLNGTALVSEVVSVPGAPIVVAESTANRTSTRIPTSTNYGFTYDALGVLVDRTLTTTTYDANGQTVTVDDRGDATTSADDACTTISYAYETDSTLAAKNLVTQVAEAEVVSATCGTTVSRPADLVSLLRTTYDGDGRILRSERLDPADGVGTILVSEILDYDDLGRPLASVDPLGNVTTTAYQQSAGGLPQLLTVTHPDLDGWGPLPAFVETTAFDPITGLVSSTTDPNGRVTSRTYDAIGRLTAVVLPQHQGLTLPSIAYQYLVDPNGLNSIVTKTLAADGTTQQVSSTLYDGLQRVFQTQAPGLDAGADDDATTAERGRMVTQTYYDSAGRVMRQTGRWPAEGAPSAAPIVPIAVPPSSTTYQYDPAGRVVAEVFWVGTESDPANERWRTTTTYDGETVLVIPPMGATPMETIVDARGRAIERIEYVRDPDDDATADTATEVLALAHQSTTYKFDAAGQLIETRDPDDNLWTYDYDWGGRLVASDDPDAGATTTTYDVLDRVTTQTDANGNTLAYTYDALGRATTLRDDSVTGTIRAQWTYDASLDGDGDRVLGQLSSSTRFVDGAAYTSTVDRYDDAYRPLATTFTLPGLPEFVDALGSLSFTTAYTYATDGQTASVALPAIVSEAGSKALGAETVTTRFDSASVPSWMGGGFGWGTYVADSNVGVDGRVRGLDLGNTYGAYVTYQYEDGTERLSNISLTRQSYGVGLSFDYGYDAAGNVTSISDQASTLAAQQDNQCFGYDGLNRLEVAWSSASGDCAVAQSALTTADVGGVSPYWTEYEYDALGNRTSLVEHAVAGGSATVTDYTHGGSGFGAHQLASLVETVGGVSAPTAFAYDDAGNRTSSTTAGDATAYEWDAEGELVGVDDDEYVYDASGSRIVRADESGTTVYLPAGQEVLISPDGDVSAKRYYSFAGQMVAVRESRGLSGVDSVVLDHQGSVVASVPNTEWAPDSVQIVRTDPFGGARGGSDAGVPGDKRFLGLTRDESTGLSLFGARYYDSVTGTFLSVDPVLDPEIPAQFNAYVYGWNNPVTHADPSGLKPGKKIGPVKSKGLSHHSEPDPPPVDPNSWDSIKAALDEAVAACPSLNMTACTQESSPEWVAVMGKWGFDYQGDGIYQSSPTAWQLAYGYYEYYDLIHSIFTGGKADRDYLEFEDYDGTTYRLWWWKGYYLNEGAGAEVAMYTQDPDDPEHWIAAPIENTPSMSVTVKDRASGDVIAEFAPNDPQRWVFVANSNVQDLGPADIEVEYSITFPTDDMFNAARKSDGAQDLLGATDYEWDWNATSKTVTYSWGRRRRMRRR